MPESVSFETLHAETSLALPTVDSESDTVLSDASASTGRNEPPEADTEPSAAETVSTEQRPDIAPLSVAEIRSQWLQKIAREVRLPQPLRNSLTRWLEGAEIAPQATEPQLSISQVAMLFGETFPSLLQRPVEVKGHPLGERFFQGGELTAAEAARVAREQLARTGFGSE